MGEGNKMKKILCLIVCMLLISAILPVIDSVQITSSDKLIGGNRADFLVKTQWEQHGYYKAKCPRNNTTNRLCRLGCWSVAIGQIVNYYKLQTHGFVHYNCSYFNTSPKEIKNDLDATFYNWSNMPYNLSGASWVERDNVSQLLYDVATVCQKDFGTGTYVIFGGIFNVSAMINELREHIDYISINTIWDGDLTETDIKTEINSQRPIMFYIRNISSLRGIKTYHAVVLDGYGKNSTTGKFQVHLNYGWDEGNPHPLDESWYDYDQPFPYYNDVTFRKGMLIRLGPHIPIVKGPQNGIPGKDYDYEAVTTSHNNLLLYYKWDWGDGTQTDWMGRYYSGEPCYANHTWKDKGKYIVKVKARDTNGAESDWGTLEVTMPRERSIQNFPFARFFERFIISFPILRNLLRI
jgi:hypothetical protein